jgi:DNA-binding transcriptional regulator YiaG
MKNLGEAVEDLLARHLSASRKQQVQQALEEQTPDSLLEQKARRSQTSEVLPSAYQQDRMARYQQVIKLHEQGMTQNAIAQQIGMSHQTVQRWLAAGAFPECTRHQYVSQLDPYLPYLILRWAQGCHNIAVKRDYHGILTEESVCKEGAKHAGDQLELLSFSGSEPDHTGFP